MKPISLLPLVLLVTVFASAQTSVNVRKLSAAGVDCPVDLQAARGGAVWERKLVKDGEANPASPAVPRDHAPALQGARQQIHLIVKNLSTRAIVGAELTAHGFSDHWRALPLAGGASAPDRAQQIKVAVSVEGNGHATQDLALSRFTSITSIDVNALTYADGSTWRATAAGACSVTPSALVLLGSNQQ